MTLRTGQLIGGGLLSTGLVGLLMLVGLGRLERHAARTQAEAADAAAAVAAIQSAYEGHTAFTDLVSHAQHDDVQDAYPLASQMDERLGGVAARVRQAMPSASLSRADPLLDRMDRVRHSALDALSARDFAQLSRDDELGIDVLAFVRDLQQSAAQLKAAARVEQDFLGALLPASILLYVLLIGAVWRGLVVRIVRPLRSLQAEASAAAEQGRLFTHRPRGTTEADEISEAVGELTADLRGQVDQVREAKREAEREAGRRIMELVREKRAQEFLDGASREQLDLFERLADALARLQSPEEITAQALAALCRLVGSQGAAVQLVGSPTPPVQIHLAQGPRTADGRPEHSHAGAARLRASLEFGVSMEPSGPRGVGFRRDGGADFLLVDSRGGELGKLRVADRIDPETGEVRPLEERHVSHCRPVAALLSSNLERARQTELLARQLILMVQMRDPDESYEHVQRVAALAVDIYERYIPSRRGHGPLGEGGEAFTSDDLRHAARLHDVGKVGVSDRILRKAGNLDDAERDAMRSHTERGEAILRLGLSRADRLAAEVALHHHQRWDGTGYPAVAQADGSLRPLVSESIPLAARIVAVADVLDALLSKRVYKDAWPLDDALGEIVRGAGTQFDPDIILALQAAVNNPRVRSRLVD